MHTVLGLVVDDRLRAVDDGICDFYAAVGGQAVHVDSVFSGERHAAFVADPAFILADGVYHPGGVFDGYQRPPTFGIDDIGIIEGFVHVVDDFETASSLPGIVGGILQDLRHQLKLRWMGKCDIRAKLGEEFDDRLRQRKRFSVGFGIGPGHNYFFALQIAFLLDTGHQVGHGLAGVVDVALHVDDGDTGVFGHITQVFVAIAPIAVANGNTMSIGREDSADLFGGIAVRDLHFVGFQEDGVSAEARHAGLEGVASAGG